MNYTYEFFTKLPKELYPNYLQKFYKEIMGKSLNLKNPKAFSEKIQWLKLYDSTSLKTQLADKLALRNIVRNIIPDLKFANIYSVAHSFEEIDFDKCPTKFVLKTNFSCKDLLKIWDKSDFLSEEKRELFENHKAYFKHLLARHYAFNSCFELHYKDIPRKIYAEEYIDNTEGEDGYVEYKINCFNGAPRYIEYFIDHEVGIFDIEWNQLDFAYIDYPKITKCNVVEPKSLKKMLDYATILSKSFKFVRIDFYEYMDDLFLSEMTFTPFSGFTKFDPPEYDYKIGELLNIN